MTTGIFIEYQWVLAQVVNTISWVGLWCCVVVHIAVWFNAIIAVWFQRVMLYIIWKGNDTMSLCLSTRFRIKIPVEKFWHLGTWQKTNVVTYYTSTLLLSRGSTPLYGVVTRGQFWPPGILVAPVRPSVRHQVCPRDNSSPVQARITKFGPKMPTPWLRYLLFWGSINLDLQGQI